MTENDRVFADFGADAPGGQNIEYSPQFDEVRLARESEPDFLPQGEWQTELKKADWPKVVRISRQLLTEQSKDLQLVCWLAEGLCHTEGVEGLKAGVTGIYLWLEKYWDTGWPASDEEGVLTRRSILARVDKDIAHWLSTYPFFGVAEGAISHWRAVQRHSGGGRQKESSGQIPTCTLDAYQTWAVTLAGESLSTQQLLHAQLSSLLCDIDHLCHSLDPEMLTPVLSRTAKLLEIHKDCLEYLQHWVCSPLDKTVASNEEPLTLPVPEEEERQAPGQEFTRDYAIQQILLLAHFFRQKEPSSPVPFLLERAARWAEMTLTDWLEEMLKDDGSLKSIEHVLKGIDKK